MKSNWEKIFRWCLVHEGGYVNHPRDPGGATNKGVTQAVYNAFRKGQGTPVRSVKEIVDQEVRDIYRKQYWDRVQGDELPSGVDYAVYDFAVNSGVSRSAKYLQQVVGVTADGDIGQMTLAAVSEMRPEDVIRALCQKRMAFLRRLRTFSTFGRGWTRRVMGDKDGFQELDTGVIDRSILLARSEPLISGPVVRDDNAGIKASGPERIGATISDALKDNTALATVATTAGGTILTTLSTPPMAYFVGASLVIAVAVGAFVFVRKARV